MNKLTVQSVIASALVATVGILPAATPAIGVAISNGNVSVNDSVVPGNATLFEGNTVETGAAASRLQWKNGKTAQLSVDSKGTVYNDRLVLERGASQSGGNLEIDARTLKISGGAAQVSVSGNTVQVAALMSPVNVSTSTGIRLANLMPGRALAFTPQDAGASAPATLTGCVRKSGAKGSEVFVLTDETSNVTVQLVGGGIEKHWRHSIKVTGTPGSGTTPAAGTAQVINVTNVEMVTAKCKAGTGGTTTAGLGRSGAVIAGVTIAAGAGVIIGVLAVHNESEQSNSISPGR